MKKPVKKWIVPKFRPQYGCVEFIVSYDGIIQYLTRMVATGSESDMKAMARSKTAALENCQTNWFEAVRTDLIKQERA